MQDDFRQSVEFSHDLLKRHISQGDRVLDATAGNGKDTLFLAELVGPQGKVWAFDIQKKAINNTDKLLKDNNVREQVSLIQAGHENLNEFVEEPVMGIIFNLGYLPGGDKNIVTRPETTLKALISSLEILQVAGVIVMVFYTGHEGGREEFDHIFDYAKELDYNQYNVLYYHFINQKKPPAELVGIKKRGL